MGWIDIFFPSEAKNRRAKDIRLKHEKARKDLEVAYRVGQEKIHDSVAAKSLEEGLAELSNADRANPAESRHYDLEHYRGEVLRDLITNYTRGNLEVITGAVDRLTQNDFFAKTFLYKPQSTKKGVYRGATLDAEPLEETEITRHGITFDPRDLITSARQLVDLAKKAYYGAEHQRVLGAGNPQDQNSYRTNLELGRKVYDLLSRTAQYLVKSRHGYASLSDEHKKALGELNELLVEIKPEPSTKILGITSIIGLMAGIALSSMGLTGNAISNLSNTTSSWIGGVLILIGIIGCFFWVKSKK